MGKQFTLYSAEAYSEPCQESKMKLFQWLTIFGKSSILDVCQGSEKPRYELHKLETLEKP